MFSLSGKVKSQIPCFPCAVATLTGEAECSKSGMLAEPSSTGININYILGDTVVILSIMKLLFVVLLPTLIYFNNLYL